MARPTTIDELLTNGADTAPALRAPGRPTLPYRGLRAQVAETATRLAALGIGRDDTVAIVLPNGPEMASAFVAMGAAAVTAPLNPAYRRDECLFYLGDLDAKLLVVGEGVGDAAAAAAAELGVPIARLRFDPADPAGVFALGDVERRGAAAGTGDDRARAARPARPDDVALVLHTSGTTSRPKLVPLSQRNVCASAAAIADSLALAPADACLNIMPLFHIHGLIAAVLSTLHAGASVICTPGFDAFRFFGWLAEQRPSWYTGVPTMHQAILSRAARSRDAIDAARLRFVRSSSASLPPQVMSALEAAFGAPVVEAYGMTEAAHQMASNPLPPGDRVPGSVGVAAGPEIAVMDEAGRLLGAGEVGEIVIRGPNVTRGYLRNADANAAAFTDGWFRTGDQGTIDARGYVRLTGRLKEIINRGGEKISPREVDEVLLDHPEVAQVVTFALPDDRLGEDVAAAVVRVEGSAVEAGAIRAFAAERLAAMKVPRTIVFVDEIPKGATGKLQRIGLAERLGLVRSGS